MSEDLLCGFDMEAAGNFRGTSYTEPVSDTAIEWEIQQGMHRGISTRMHPLVHLNAIANESK